MWINSCLVNKIKLSQEWKLEVKTGLHNTVIKSPRLLSISLTSAVFTLFCRQVINTYTNTPLKCEDASHGKKS